MSGGSDTSASRSTAMRPSVPTKTRAALAADRLARIGLAVDDHAVGVAVVGAAVVHEEFHRARVVGTGGPLDDVVVVLAPVELADVEAMGAGVAVVGEIGRRPEVEVPIQILGDRLGRAEALRPDDRAAVAVGVDLLQLADAAAADEFAGPAELAVVFAALLRAGLVDAAVAPAPPPARPGSRAR